MALDPAMFSFLENINLKTLIINRLCLLLSAVNVIWLLKILPKTVKCPKKKQEPLLISTIYLMLKHPRKQVRYYFFVHFGAKYGQAELWDSKTEIAPSCHNNKVVEGLGTI